MIFIDLIAGLLGIIAGMFVGKFILRLYHKSIEKKEQEKWEKHLKYLELRNRPLGSLDEIEWDVLRAKNQQQLMEQKRCKLNMNN